MSISGISSSVLSLLQAQQAKQQQSAAGSSAGAAGGSSSDSAYQLSLGQQQQTVSDLLSYSAMGKMVKQADSVMAELARDHTNAAIAVDGANRPLVSQHTVDVQQLAAAQAVVSGSAADSDYADFGTGTLTLNLGSVDAQTGVFTAGGQPVTIAITNGTLDGIAAAINGAKAGVTATVEQSGGLYDLRVTGDSTGAANAFTLSGIPALAYDPTGTTVGGMAAVQSAQDALYSVDGGDVQSSPTNTGVVLAPGVAQTFTATGSFQVSAIVGQGGADAPAGKLVQAFDSLLGQLTQMGGDATASDLAKALGQVAGGTFAGKGLADIGISQQADGTLSLDTAKLEAAFGADPSGTSMAINEAAAAFQKVLDGASGQNAPIQTQMQSLVDLLTRGTTLIDYLSGNAGGSSSQSPFG